MRIARFVVDDDPVFGVVGGADGDEIVASLVGDPLYSGVELTGEQHALDLRYLHTETDGEAFESMRANLDAVASQTGMGDVFRLRGADVYHVERVARLGVAPAEQPRPVDLLEPLEHVVRRLAALRPQRIAYVSCDPATFARDLAVFAEHGYRMDGLRAFDAFPMTHHVECVGVLLPA